MGSIRGDTQYRDLAIKRLTDFIRSPGVSPLAQSGQAHYLSKKAFAFAIAGLGLLSDSVWRPLPHDGTPDQQYDYCSDDSAD